MTIKEAERRLILSTLEHYRGSKEKTAEVLGVSAKTLYNRLLQYGASSSLLQSPFVSKVNA